LRSNAWIEIRGSPLLFVLLSFLYHHFHHLYHRHFRLLLLPLLLLLVVVLLMLLLLVDSHQRIRASECLPTAMPACLPYRSTNTHNQTTT